MFPKRMRELQRAIYFSEISIPSSSGTLTGGAQGGVHATDVTNASRTQLLNLKTLNWDEKLLATFEIPRAVLPAVRSSSEVYGEASLGAIAGVPICGILGDQQAALVGQACFRPGRS